MCAPRNRHSPRALTYRAVACAACIGAWMLLAHPTLRAASPNPHIEPTEPDFWVNVYFLRADDCTRTYTEVFVEVPYSELTFVKSAERPPTPDDKSTSIFQANADVMVFFEDGSGALVQSSVLSDTIRAAASYANTTQSQTRVFYFSFELDPGLYTLRAVVVDHYSNRHRSVIRKVSVRGFSGPGLYTSSLQLSSSPLIFTRSFPLQPQQSASVPNLRQIFAAETADLYLFFEVYNLMMSEAASDSFFVHYEIRNDKEVVRSIHETYPKPGKAAAVRMRVPIGSLAPDRYLLTVTVREGVHEAATSAQVQIVPSFDQKTKRLLSI